MLKLKKFSFFVFGKGGGEGVGCTSFEIKYQYFNSSDLWINYKPMNANNINKSEMKINMSMDRSK